MRLLKIAIVLACGLKLGCVDNATPTANEAVSPNMASPDGLSVGDTVGGLHVPILLQANGKESLSLDELRGSTIVLEFWATWCGPCVAAIGHLNDVADEFRDEQNVRFISITDEPTDTVKAFLDRKPIHTWIGLDQDQTLHRAFGVSGIPQTIVINPEGKLAGKISPSRLDAQLISRIQEGELLNSESSGSVIVAGVDPAGAPENPPLMQFILRESVSSSMGGSSAMSGTASTMLGQTPEQLVSRAFGLRSTRTEFAVELPDKRFDLITLFPKSTGNVRQFLKLAIGSVLDVTTRQEMRKVDVFVLNTSENGEHSLSPTASTGGSSMGANQTEINVVNGSVSNALYSLEAKLNRPIVDETDMDGKYDFVVKWEKDATAEEIARAFTDATGLVLTPAQREIEFTVVESRNTAQ